MPDEKVTEKVVNTQEASREMLSDERAAARGDAPQDRDTDPDLETPEEKPASEIPEEMEKARTTGVPPRDPESE